LPLPVIQSSTPAGTRQLNPKRGAQSLASRFDTGLNGKSLVTASGRHDPLIQFHGKRDIFVPNVSEELAQNSRRKGRHPEFYKKTCGSRYLRVPKS
jgi:hypothetical protein